jgi:HEPN domain-containing protein
MQLPAHEEAWRWLDEALADLDTARYLAAGRRFNTACSISQQAAEKAVKGSLYGRGVEDPWGHSVATLIEDALTFDASLASVRDDGPVLDKYYIPTRYPNGLPGGIPSRAYTAEDACQAIAAAERIIAAARQRLVG